MSDKRLEAKRDGAAAKRFLKRLLRRFNGEPRRILTYKLCSYPIARGEVMPAVINVTDRYADN
ncbi:MAG TPA: hypothetical protein DCQ67_08290 [Acidimicrobiaceae bacterium]|nr:hypothetical protein [Acidimicrobiaceae bacterium]